MLAIDERRTPQLRTTKQAAAELGMSPGTLAVWRCRKKQSLAYVRVGRAIRYSSQEIQRFIAANTHKQ